jgi:hypothetical protein
MNTYSVKYRLTSCIVDKELLQEIEKYILAETREYFESLEQDGDAGAIDNQDLYHVFIQAKEESYRLASIDEYDDDILPENVQTVILDFNSYKSIFMNIRVLFHSSFSEQPAVEISLKGQNAKEICSHFGAGIKSIVNKKRNTNHLFHNRALLLSMLIVYTVWNVINYFVLTFTQSASLAHLANNILFNFLFALLSVWVILSIFMRPYITFRTSRQTILTIGYNFFSILYFAAIFVLFYHNFRK